MKKAGPRSSKAEASLLIAAAAEWEKGQGRDSREQRGDLLSRSKWCVFCVVAGGLASGIVPLGIYCTDEAVLAGVGGRWRCYSSDCMNAPPMRPVAGVENRKPSSKSSDGTAGTIAPPMRWYRWSAGVGTPVTVLLEQELHQ